MKPSKWKDEESILRAAIKKYIVTYIRTLIRYISQQKPDTLGESGMIYLKFWEKNAIQEYWQSYIQKWGEILSQENEKLREFTTTTAIF